jgi:hypothetical protein
MKKADEFENFDRTMRELMKVSHSEIKAKLDAEKSAKEHKRKSKEKTDDLRAKDDSEPGRH